MYRILVLIFLTGCPIPLDGELVSSSVKQESLTESDCPLTVQDIPLWVKNCNEYISAIPNCEFECPDYTYEPGCEPEIITEYVEVESECPSLTCPDIPDLTCPQCPSLTCPEIPSCELDCDSCPANEVEVIVEVPGDCEEPVELTCWDGLPENPYDGDCSNLPSDAVFVMTFDEPGENGCVYKKCEWVSEESDFDWTGSGETNPNNCFTVDGPAEYFSGGQVKFEGNSYIDCGDNKDVEIDFPITISAWIKKKSFQAEV